MLNHLIVSYDFEVVCKETISEPQPDLHCSEPKSKHALKLIKNKIKIKQ